MQLNITINIDEDTRDFIRHHLWNLGRKLDEILTKENTIMGLLDDKISAIKAAITQLGADLQTAIDDLKANTGAPTAAQLTALDDIATSLTTLDTNTKASDPGPGTGGTTTTPTVG